MTTFKEYINEARISDPDDSDMELEFSTWEVTFKNNEAKFKSIDADWGIDEENIGKLIVDKIKTLKPKYKLHAYEGMGGKRFELIYRKKVVLEFTGSEVNSYIDQGEAIGNRMIEIVERELKKLTGKKHPWGIVESNIHQVIIDTGDTPDSCDFGPTMGYDFGHKEYYLDWYFDPRDAGIETFKNPNVKFRDDSQNFKTLEQFAAGVRAGIKYTMYKDADDREMAKDEFKAKMLKIINRVSLKVNGIKTGTWKVDIDDEEKMRLWIVGYPDKGSSFQPNITYFKKSKEYRVWVSFDPIHSDHKHHLGYEGFTNPDIDDLIETWTRIDSEKELEKILTYIMKYTQYK